jgi:hypothetical protein
LVPLVVAALLLAFVIGALSQVGRGSGPYRRTVDRSFAALASMVAVRSNATGQALAELMVNGPKMDRAGFFSALDTIASNAVDDSRQLESIVPPAPSGGAGDGCLAALAARASAAATMRQSLEGILGGTDGASVVPPAQGLAALGTASSKVVGADDDWATCRRAMHRAPGTPVLPASLWLAGQGWYTPAALASSVNSIAFSRTLVARHALQITATRLDPTPLPGSGPALVAPTQTLTVHVVVSDQGNVDEPAVQVRASLVGGPAPAPAPRSTTVSLGAGRSMAVVLGPFSVVQGSAYTLQVFVTPTSGIGGTSAATALQVASEPTTTTTTTATTTTTTTTPKRQGKPTSGP